MAEGNPGNGVTVTTGAGTTVSGDIYGIFTTNADNGDLTINANGNVTGSEAIVATNGPNGSSLYVTTGATSIVEGSTNGIRAANLGNGQLSVTANGNVTSTVGDGIIAQNSAAGSDLSVTAGTGTTVMGNDYGIFADNGGSGTTAVNVNGNVYSTIYDAIYAASAGSGLTVTTGAGSTVDGQQRGISARHTGTGAVQVTANGNVTGTAGDGIEANNSATGTNLTVTTGGTVMADSFGIDARNYGNGLLSVEANGNVTGSTNDGIYARSATNGTGLTVTTGAGTTVDGGQRGIRARNLAGGTLEVTAGGDVAGTNFDGIFAENKGTDVTVTTDAGTLITGATYGIFAANGDGTGAVTVNANGNVTGTTAGILARNGFDGTDIVTVTTGGGTTVTGGIGIRASHLGDGAVGVTANGDVTGTTFEGIAAENINGTDLFVTTAAGTSVFGNTHGIEARAFGGTLIVTTDGNVTGTGDDGIFASNTGTSVVVEVGSTIAVGSNGADADDFAIETAAGPADVTVAGVLDGGGGGALRFAQTNPFANSLELTTSAIVNGNVIGGSGTDTLILSGGGTGAFNVGQLQNFEAIGVEDGTWNLSGATTADAEVNGGTLKGTGTFGTLTVNGGTLAPGNSIGTITVNGPFTLGAGTVFEVEVNAQGQNDKVIVNGTVNLTGSILRVLAANGNYKPKTEYVIIENDGTDAVNGTFASVTSSLAFLTPTVLYDGGTGNDVVLILIRNDVPFDDFGDTPNEEAVAKGLGNCSLTNPLCVAVFNLASGQIGNALNQLSGEIHATLAGVLADDSRYVREAVLGRLVQATYTNNAGEFAALAAGGPQVASLDSQAMALGYSGKSLSAPAAEPLAFWTRAYGAWGDFDGDGNAATADRDLGGFISGMDANIGGGWRAGLATGASFSNVSVAARYSSADVETYHLGGYLGGMASVFALRGGGMWAWNDIDTSRAVVFPGFYERQKASYDADTGQLFGEVAYPTQMMGMALEPFGGLAYVSIGTDSFRERGGPSASLRGSSEDQDVGYSTVGLRAATTMQSFGMAVTPNLSMAWLHAFDDVTPGAALAFASTGIGFAIEGGPLAEDSVLIEAGLDFALADDMTAGVSYSGQFGDGVSDNGVKGRFTWLF